MIRILIADPDPATRKALALLLKRKLGTDGIVEVQDVEALIRALTDSTPDLLLLDWRLYGSPAPETCQLLRKAYPHLKIILLSVDPDDETAAKESGANFIYKGAAPDELILVLQSMLTKRNLQEFEMPANEIKTSNMLLILFALCAVAFHIALNGQYGFHRDELDFIMNARQLDWGYVSYPPVTPFFARLGLELFGNSLRGLRVFPAIAQGIVMILAGLMARDMGGKRMAQLLTAFAVFIVPVSLFGGTVIMYFAFDYLWWVLVAFFFVRLLVTDDPRYWLGIGAGIGLGMMTKYTMIFWVAGLAVAVLATDARKYLRSKWLYLGAALALLIFLPNLIWQIKHDLIALKYLPSIHARDVDWGRADDFLPKQLYETTNPFSLPIWTVGLSLCLFGASMKRFRALGWLFVTTFVIFLLSQGRSYYTGPSYVMLLAAGSVWWVDWLSARSGKMRKVGFGLLWGTQVIGSLIGIILMKPIAPLGSPLWEVSSNVNGELREMIGWQDLTKQVADIYQSIPESEKPRTVILAGNYGEAGALDFYGDEYGLPRVISGANSLWYRGYGDPEPETVIVVGFERDYAGKFFKSCQFTGMVKNSYGVKNEESTRHTGLYICRQPRAPWSEMWQEMQWFQ